jgi:hypothetical protein
LSAMGARRTGGDDEIEVYRLGGEAERLDPPQ